MPAVDLMYLLPRRPCFLFGVPDSGQLCERVGLPVPSLYSTLAPSSLSPATDLRYLRAREFRIYKFSYISTSSKVEKAHNFLYSFFILLNFISRISLNTPGEGKDGEKIVGSGFCLHFFFFLYFCGKGCERLFRI